MAPRSRTRRISGRALAIAAHPDDIEFMMAGTLILLRQAGLEIHYHTVANGCCGSRHLNRRQTRLVREREARQAAAILGAQFHPSLVNDLEIFYELKTLRRLAALIRHVRPTILLIPSPEDYMEDHTNTCRLAVTAAFTRGMKNFPTTPARPPYDGDVVVYHAQPHGLCDTFGRTVRPDLFVNTGSVHRDKIRALTAHRSQQDWLNATQKMNSYIAQMDAMSRSMGKMSKRFTHAEGWRRHHAAGFCAPAADPLRSL